MDDSERKHIIKNMPELVRTTKFPELINACEKKKLLSSVMRTRIENSSDSDEEEKHKELFIKITKRGPTAYEDLLKILVELDCSQAVTLLRKPKLNKTPHISMHDPSDKKPMPKEEALNLPDGCYPPRNSSNDKVNARVLLKPYTEQITLSKPMEVKKSKTLNYDKKVPFYPMKTKNRGVLLMVNIIDFPRGSEEKRRDGAEIDGKYLLYLFQELGFACFPYNNLTREAFFDVLHELHKSEYCAKTESFVLVLMSHGEMSSHDLHDRVIFHDGAVVKVSEIEDHFSNHDCPNLANKPKVLIFPFCRGRKTDKGVPKYQYDSISKAQSVYTHIATRSDLLVCYASVRGYQTLRDRESGSWYIQAFCEILAENAHDTHFEDMLKLIGGRIKTLRTEAGEMQTPAYNNHGFTKLLFFNPGVFEDDDDDEGEGAGDDKDKDKGKDKDKDKDKDTGKDNENYSDNDNDDDNVNESHNDKQ